MSSFKPTPIQTLRSKPQTILVPPTPEQQEHTEFLRSHGVHIYGKSAALKIELDTLRGHETQAECHYTVLIEGANKGKAMGYDWGAKIPFQLTRRELPLVAAFLLGFSSSKLELKNHGPEANKSLTLEEQKGKLFVKVAQTGRAPVPVPVEPADVFAWGELCMVALQLNRPTVSPGIHLALLRRVGRMSQQPPDA